MLQNQALLMQMGFLPECTNKYILSNFQGIEQQNIQYEIMHTIDLAWMGLSWQRHKRFCDKF